MNFAGRRGQHVHNPFVRHRHHTLMVDLDDAMANPDAAPFGNAATQQGTNLKEMLFWGFPLWALTTPFWTEKPSWYLVSGRRIRTSTTGGVETTVRRTAVEDLAF